MPIPAWGGASGKQNVYACERTPWGTPGGGNSPAGGQKLLWGKEGKKKKVWGGNWVEDRRL